MVNFNGTLLAKDSNFFNHTNRAFLFGDALFEEIRSINGRLIYWEQHYFRLMGSMRILRMEIPMGFTMEFLEGEILNTLESNGLFSKPAAAVTLCVYRNPGTDPSVAGNGISYVISVTALAEPLYTLNEGLYGVELFRDFFVNRDMLSKLNTNNRALEVVASIFAQENKCSDCILLNTDKHVVGTLSGALFMVKDGNIKTPPILDGARNTVIRKKLLEIVRSMESHGVEESSISPFELQKADELFLVNTVRGIQSITKYRKKTYENKVAKDLLGKLNANVQLENGLI